jgi:membrane protein YdbS with pleckstrin-like domain
VPYPESLLHDGEEVVVHLHPHWSTVLRPVLTLLVLVAAASFAAGAVPAGPHQGTWRLAVLGAAAALVLAVPVRPLLRWAATHYVLTTDRLLLRSGLLARSERDVVLARVVEVSSHRTPAQRLLRSGTVELVATGDAGRTVLHAVPRSERFRQLVDELLDAAGEPLDAPSWHGTAPLDDDGLTRVVGSW